MSKTEVKKKDTSDSEILYKSISPIIILLLNYKVLTSKIDITFTSESLYIHRINIFKDNFN